MKEAFLPSGRRVVVPENDLEERVVVALMAALAGDPEEGRRLRSDAVYREDGTGTFETFNPDRFYYLEHLSDGRLVVVCSDD